MKNFCLTLTIIIAFSSFVFGQQKPVVTQINSTTRTETYASFKYHSDSLRFTIVGKNDTVLTEDFYANGQLKKQSWRNDSIYFFDKLGRLNRKDILPNKQNNQKKTEISFYTNQKIKEITTSQQEDEEVWQYSQAGALEMHAQNTQIAPSVFYAVWTDEQNSKRLSRREITKYVYQGDSTTLYLDTLFYQNGRIKKTQSYANRQVLTFAEYDQNGQQIAPLFPDSLRLLPFKDNYNCFYGLKNRHDDTLFSPRFDNVLTLRHEDLYTVQIGDRVQLWRQDGKQLSKNVMNSLRNLNTGAGWYNRTPINISPRFSDIGKSDWEEDITTYKRNDVFFNFESDTGNGIITADGTVVIPPQYLPFYEVDNLGKYFAFSKMPHSYSSKQSKVIDRSGKILFNDRYPYIEISPIQGYFYTANQDDIEDEKHFALKGLVDSVGTEILPTLYNKIEPFDGNQSNLVWVDLGKEQIKSENEKEFVTVRSGIFNIKTRKWHVPLNILVTDNYHHNETYLVTQQVDIKKLGLVSSKGAIVLPFVYDTMFLSDDKTFNILVKNGNYQFYDFEKKSFSSDYTFLHNLNIGLDKPKPAYFAAKRAGKWGIIDAQEKIVLPFEYDYATNDMEYGDNKSLILVKNNEISIYEYACFPKPLPKPYMINKDEEFQAFNLIDEPSRFCLVDMKKGLVVLPPQYKALKSKELYRIVEAENGKRKILFNNETELIDYPFEAFPEHISESKNLILFQNKKVMQIAHLRQGKIRHSITEGGIAIGSDSLDNYFISELPPIKKEDKKPQYSLNDTLSEHDRNWIWLDQNGKRLCSDTFRYPLPFKEGLGIGMVGDKYGIWREDGNVFAPPQYESINYDTENELFFLFKNIGLKNWLVMMDTKGKTLVNTGLYDGISKFYQDYALVSFNEKIGLIDTDGREIIAPIVMENNTVNFLDSLNYVARYAKLEGKKFKNTEMDYMDDVIPVSTRSYEIDFDTLPFLAQNRNLVFNILLKPQLPYLLRGANNRNIYRGQKRIQSHNTYWGGMCGTGIVYKGSIRFPTFSTDVISFTTTKIGRYESDLDYINYRRRNNEWQKVQIKDVLNLTIDNSLKINDLLGRKIQSLKGKDIDCGDVSSFLERSQQKALLTERGIDFYFNGKGNYAFNIPVELTWQELKAFLK